MRNLDDFGILGILEHMHPLQEKILTIVSEKNIGGFTLRNIGELVGEKLPKKLNITSLQLERKGFILIDRKIKKSAELATKQKLEIFLFQFQ